MWKKMMGKKNGCNVVQSDQRNGDDVFCDNHYHHHLVIFGSKNENKSFTTITSAPCWIFPKKDKLIIIIWKQTKTKTNPNRYYHQIGGFSKDFLIKFFFFFSEFIEENQKQKKFPTKSFALFQGKSNERKKEGKKFRK